MVSIRMSLAHMLAFAFLLPPIARGTDPSFVVLQDNIVAEADVQEGIGHVVKVYSDAVDVIAHAANREAERDARLAAAAAVAREVTTLRLLVADDEVRLTRQVIFYLLDKRKNGREEDFRAGLIVNEAHILPSSQIEAVIPYLHSADPDLRNIARGTFDSVVFGDRNRDGSPAHLIEHVAPLFNSQRQPPSGLVEYIYELCPGRSLLCLARSFRVKGDHLQKLLWAEHVISDTMWKQDHQFLKPGEADPEAVKQVELCSEHDQWWVRLYAAEVMRQRPALRTDKAINRLAGDSDPLVHKAVERIRQDRAAPMDRSSATETKSGQSTQ